MIPSIRLLKKQQKISKIITMVKSNIAYLPPHFFKIRLTQIVSRKKRDQSACVNFGFVDFGYGYALTTNKFVGVGWT